MKGPATKPPVYTGPVLPPEDQHKILQSNYYRITPLSHHLGHPIHPVFKECNLRVDFGTDGGIYKVEWTNVPIKEGKK